MRIHNALRAFLIAAFAVFFAAANVGTAHADTKVVVIDFQAALQEVQEGKLVQARLEGIYNEKAASLRKMEEQLMALQQAYEKQAMVLSDEAKRQKEQEFMAGQAQYQQMVMQSEQEFQATYGKEMETLIQKMRKAAGELAKAKGYDIVLDAAAVAYSGPNVPDLTADLITSYNKSNPG